MNSDNPIKILFLASDPSDASRLRLGQEWRDIQTRLQLAKQREKFVLEQRMSVRPGDISQAILDVEPQIVHFSGHGTSTGELCFENELGKIKPVQSGALAALFEVVDEKIKCVVLNACYSETQAEAIAKHIQYVIGMNKAIGDQAAIAFAVGFYKALGANLSIEKAYKFGCAEIQLEGIPEHLTPVIHEKKNVKDNHCESKWILVLSATINDVDRPMAEAIVAHLRQISGDASLTLKKIEAGSVKLFLEGSQEGLKRIESLFREGKLTEILGLPIQEVEEEASETTTLSEAFTQLKSKLSVVASNRQRILLRTGSGSAVEVSVVDSDIKLERAASQVKPSGSSWLQAIVDNFVDGILILTEQGECVQSNEYGRQVCRQLSQDNTSQINSIPQEIWQACESLIEIRNQFSQRIIIESEIDAGNAAVFRVRVRGLELEDRKHPYLLVTLENRRYSTQKMAMADVHKYGLTPREAEVWLLRRASYSYKEIADRIYITVKTVKKHLKNIYAKQQAIIAKEEAQ